MEHVSTAMDDAVHGVEDLGVVDGLVQLSMLVQRLLRDLALRFDLSILQIRLLGVLRDREPTMAQLAQLLELDKSSATGLVDRAERHGLVRREHVLEDGRAFRVVPTDKGRRLASEGQDMVAEELTALTAHLREAQRRELSLLASEIVGHYAAANGIDPSSGRSTQSGPTGPDARIGRHDRDG